MSQLPERRANKALPAEWARSLSVELTKHSPLPEQWASSLRNRAYKPALFNTPVPLQNLPWLINQLL